MKEITTRLEEQDELGRLFDMDVLGPEGEKLSRPAVRRCLVCGGPVQACARSRAHSLETLQERTEQILKAFAREHLADCAVNALLAEARLTPKPGLVDEANNGAHRDMDLSLLERSAYSLRPFFAKAAELGLSGPDCAAQLQQEGLRAEQGMFYTTNGINTHKGALFTLGLLCAASATHLARGGSIFQIAAELACALPSVADPATHGVQVCRAYAANGAREEACAGFPRVQSALAHLREGLSPLTVLLSLMAEVEDTNLLWRGGPEGLAYVQQKSKFILAQPQHEQFDLLTAFDKACIQKNLRQYRTEKSARYCRV